jgi:glucokinase
MVEVANQRSIAQAVPASLPFLAADVGGTHARVGLVARPAGGRRPVEVLHYHRYVGAEWSSLAAILTDFVAGLGPRVAGIRHCVVASAGYVLGDAIVNENLPWPVSLSEICISLGIQRLDVVNDFEAVAYATQFLDLADTVPVILGNRESAPGPVLVTGPGTGLGSAVLLPGQPRAQVLPTEAGQIALAPGNELEADILRVLARSRAYVSVEQVLSGPGLLNAYRAIAELRGLKAVLDTPAAITTAALERRDESAHAALEVFCGLLGSFVGDLVMLYGARGVFLAGGILPQIREFLLASSFTERYFNKGVMQAYLQQVPVRLMEHGRLGVIGAAGLHLDAHADASRSN